jgi:hypothetical protein
VNNREHPPSGDNQRPKSGPWLTMVPAASLASLCRSDLRSCSALTAATRMQTASRPGIGTQIDDPARLSEPDPALSNRGIRYSRSTCQRRSPVLPDQPPYLRMQPHAAVQVITTQVRMSQRNGLVTWTPGACGEPALARLLVWLGIAATIGGRRWYDAPWVVTRRAGWSSPWSRTPQGWRRRPG